MGEMDSATGDTCRLKEKPKSCKIAERRRGVLRGARNKESGHCRGETLPLGFIVTCYYTNMEKKGNGGNTGDRQSSTLSSKGRELILRKRRCGEDTEREFKQKKQRSCNQRALNLKWHRNNVRKPHRKQSRPDSLTLQVCHVVMTSCGRQGDVLNEEVRPRSEDGAFQVSKVVSKRGCGVVTLTVESVGSGNVKVSRVFVTWGEQTIKRHKRGLACRDYVCCTLSQFILWRTGQELRDKSQNICRYKKKQFSQNGASESKSEVNCKGRVFRQQS